VRSFPQSLSLPLRLSKKPETTLLQHVVVVVVLAAVVAVGGVGMVTVTVPTVTFPTLMATQEDLIVLLQTLGQLQLALKKAKVVSVVPVGHAGLTVVAPAGVGMEMMKKDGAGRANWGSTTDENPDKEAEENVNSEEKTAEKELVPEDVPASDEAVKEKEGDATNEAEQEKEEDKEMTLEEYEKVLEEKRRAVLALKAEERKVEVDKELQSMQVLSVKKNNDEVFIKLGADKESKKKESAEEKAKKSLSINEFLKPAEGESFYGRGRGRGRER